jgi:hypothetical protein
MTEKSSTKPKGKRDRKGPDLSDLTSFLSSVETEHKPTLHVNGATHLNCVLAVDFGQPLTPPKLSDDEAEKLKEKMRVATKTIINRDVGIRVLNDPSAGVWWTSLA